MSIPSKLRSTLVEGDPQCPEQNANPRIVILYGPHLKESLQAYTIDAMSEIEAQIAKLPRGSVKRKRAARMILAKSWETEVDRDGRIVLSKELREKIGLGSEAVMVSMGEYFEIWDAEHYRATEAVDDEAFLEEQGDGFDPMSYLEEDEEA